MGVSKIQTPTSDILNISLPEECKLHINEIFHSVQGEGTRSGERCVFVRLQGCALRCTWCDTPYALQHNEKTTIMTGSEILENIKEYNCSFVEFTGGEPLEQPYVFPLMKIFCNAGYTVAVETGGHVDAEPLDARIIRIIDVKCPDSKMSSLNNYSNLEQARLNDEIKFVIASQSDYEWAKNIVSKYNLIEKTKAVLFSAVFESLEYVELVEWILRDRLNVRFQAQLHKFIWDPATRGV